MANNLATIHLVDIEQGGSPTKLHEQMLPGRWFAQAAGEDFMVFDERPTLGDIHFACGFEHEADDVWLLSITEEVLPMLRNYVSDEPGDECLAQFYATAQPLSIEPLIIKFKHLWAWDTMMGSTDSWKQMNQERAKAQNAPINAIYNSGDVWHTADTIANDETRARIERNAQELK